MSKLKGLLLTEGMHGMISQVEGLAKALDIDFTHHKVESLNNFDFIIAPEHDGLTGENVILSKGSIHYLTKEEITNNHEYLSEKLNKEKEYLSLILGGPNKYYDYNEKNLIKIFDKIKSILESNNLQAIIIPSMRTPEKIIDFTQKYLGENNLSIHWAYAIN